jgi:hypothetical protein
MEQSLLRDLQSKRERESKGRRKCGGKVSKYGTKESRSKLKKGGREEGKELERKRREGRSEGK